MVPNGWSITSLGNSVTLMQSGLSRKLSNEDIGLPVIRSGNIGESFTTFDDIKYWYSEDPQGANTNDYVLQENDILVNFINSTSQIGKTCLFHNLIERPCIYTTNLLRLQAAEVVDVHFLFYVTKTSHYDKYVQSITKPAVNQASFTTKEFRAFEFLLPPFPEQRKIAKILSTWDKAIATTERLLANKQQQKKALMQRLLTGKQRFAGFEGEWRKYSFSQIVTLGREKFDPKIEQETKLCIELEHIEQGNSRLIGSTTTANTASTKSHFCVGDILFGKLRPYLRKYWLADCSGVCSGEIWVFKADTSITIPEYIHQIIQLDSFIDITNVASGTHMPRADWSVVKDFIIHLPTIDEQRKISSLLSSFDRGTNIIVNQLDNLKLQKKALMQQLLTGKLRVKVDEAAA